MKDLIAQMRAASPVKIETSKEAWLEARGINAAAAPARGHHQKGSTTGDIASTKTHKLAEMPMELMRLPRGFITRPSVLEAAMVALDNQLATRQACNVPVVALRGMVLMRGCLSMPAVPSHQAVSLPPRHAPVCPP